MYNTIEQVEVINSITKDEDGFEHSERKEFKFNRPTQLDVELSGRQGNSVWFSDDQEMYVREDADSRWEKGVVLPELRRANVSLGRVSIRTDHQSVEELILDGLNRVLDFKAKEIIDTPEFPCGKDSDDLYMEGAQFVSEVLTHVISYVGYLQAENVDVTDLVDQLHSSTDTFALETRSA